MKLEILEKVENRVLERTEIKFRVDHTGAPTPSRKELMAALSSALGVPEELITLERISGTHGSTSSRGSARIYPSREKLMKAEREYLLKRGLPKEEKPAAPKEEAPKEEKAAAQREEKKEAPKNEEEGKSG
ncbi:MAG: hypothetical protein QW567_00670 [Candidatus Hadarchaeales archaeon]